MEITDNISLAELKQLIGELQVRNFVLEREVSKLMIEYTKLQCENSELKVKEDAG